MSFVEELKKIRNTDPLGKERVPLPTGADELPFWNIPLEYLKFNYHNNRISTQAAEYAAIKGRKLSQIDFQKANEIVEKWIWSDRTKSNENTKANILEFGQMRPGIITSDGTVVGGNRRLTILRKINREQGKSLEFRAVILKDVNSDQISYIKELEAKLQHAEDAKQDYSPIQPYLRVLQDMEEYVDTGLKTEKWIINLLEPIFKGKSLKEMYGIGKLMREYLEYIKMDELWSRITTAEDLFINLYKNLRRYSNKDKGGNIERSYDEDEVLDYKIRGFDLIRFRQNLGKKDEESKDFNSKKIRSLYYTDSKEKSIFSDAKIFNTFNETIEKAVEEVNIPSVKDLVKTEKGRINDSEAAEQIDKLWTSKVKNKFKEAIGTAASKLEDKLDESQPKKFIDAALSKLYNLIDSDALLDRRSDVVLIEKIIKSLSNSNEKADNLNKLHNIRRITAETIKQIEKN